MHVNLLYHVKINSDEVGPPIAWSSMASFQHANKRCRVIPANTGLARVGREKVHQNKRLAFGIHGRRLCTVGAFACYHTVISICTGKANLFNKTVMKKKLKTSPANVISHHIPKPTLVFHHIIPLVCDPLACFLGFLWCEDYQALVLADHVLEQRPVATALWHFCHWEPILHKARSIEHFRQGPYSGVVFQEDRDYFWRVCVKECLDFFEDIDGWLLNRKNTEGKNNSGLELQRKCTYFSGHRTTGEKNV